MENKTFHLDDNRIKELIEIAIQGREYAYATYSHFAVGAAVLVGKNQDEALQIFSGCNIENASYPAGNCAERTAIFKAVSEGYNRLKAVAIVGGAKDKPIDSYTAPCGICRQVMREFADPKELVIIMAKSVEDYKLMTLEELLPMSFGPENLNLD